MKAYTISTILYSAVCLAAANPKRGLVYIPNATTLQDDSIWIKEGSDLSWYYTYNANPNPQYTSSMEFVPMMWGMGSNATDDSFYQAIMKLKSSGQQISHALSFNEPDMPSAWGGSGLTPTKAAQGYIANFIPLRKQGIKIGLPAMSGSGAGIQWLRDFRGNCTDLMAAQGLGSKCLYDFLPIHWYDNFGGLKAHISEAAGEFPNTKIWVTEYAYAHQDLAPTQAFYNQSITYLDGNATIERYSYFGGFRSNVSNIGPNATFLNNAGKLTDIGSWYLGFGATGVIPTSG